LLIDYLSTNISYPIIPVGAGSCLYAHIFTRNDAHSH